MQNGEQKSENVCVIGAGPSGLACVKALRDRGVDCVCFEREDEVGGNWYFGRQGSSVYSGTHLISSKRQTEFADFSMPKEYPPFPSHQQALDYLRAYACEFSLYQNIRLNTTVERVEPFCGESSKSRETSGNSGTPTSSATSGWSVFLRGSQSPQQFDRLIIANGHHWSPKRPEYPGDFAGETLHSHDFKDPQVLHGKRVLVVGAGNSGCDIAVEAARHADAAWISVRRGYHFLPKFLRGRPIDSAGIRLQKLGLPLWMRRRVAGFMIKMAIGTPQRFGLPAPDHQLFETHPIINSQLFYQLGHGRLQVKGDIAHLRGDEIEFTDESRERVDLIVYATGFNVAFPFVEQRHLNWQAGLPQLHLHALHPERDDVFVVGMIQPNGGIWPLAELQAKLIARCVELDGLGEAGTGWLREQAIRAERKSAGGIRFIDSPRHRIEVDYFTYREQLSKLLQHSMRLA